MTDDDLIRTWMTAAGMLLEDLSARLVLDPLAEGLTAGMRATAADLVSIAEVVDSVRRIGRVGG